MDLENNFSSNLKYLRISKGLNQLELSKRLNKDYSTIGKWENGTRSPTMKDTLEVCKYFDVDLNDMVLRDLRFQKNVKLDDTHELDLIVLEKSKELSEDDKKFIIDMIDKLKK